MTGLILKDFLILRKVPLSYLALMAIYIALAFVGASPAEVLSGMMVVMAVMLPMNVFAYDKQAKWDTYGLALPVGRTKTVAARYLCVLLLCLLSIGLAAVAGVVLYAAGCVEDPAIYAASCAVTGLLAVLVNAIMLPFLYKFGPDRAWFMLCGIMGLLCFVTYLFLLPLGGIEWINTLGRPTSAQIAAAFAVAAAVCAVLLALSFLLSRYFYGRKDI